MFNENWSVTKTITVDEVKDIIEGKSKSLSKYTLIANEFLRKEYGMVLSVPIVLRIESDSRRKGAFTRIQSLDENSEVQKDIPMRITINLSSYIMNEILREEYILKILKHELVHYALFMKGLPSKDGDYEFEQELKRLNLPSIGDSRGTDKEMMRRLVVDVKYKLRGSVEEYIQCEEFSGFDEFGPCIITIDEDDGPVRARATPLSLKILEYNV